MPANGGKLNAADLRTHLTANLVEVTAYVGQDSQIVDSLIFEKLACA